MMPPPGAVTRRGFLRIGISAGGGLLVTVSLAGTLQGCRRDRISKGAVGLEMNAYVEISTDGLVTITSPVPEIGQGVRTALPMIVAEELSAEWEKVRVRQAPIDPDRFGHMAVGGSDSVADYYEPLRRAGAAARETLVAAAAGRWGVPAGECRAGKGRVEHLSTGRSLPWGDLVAVAAALPVPDPLPLKDPSTFEILGTPVRRVDVPEIVTGAARYGNDVKVAGMSYAVVVRPPVLGARLRRVSDSDAMRVPGVRGVVTIVPVETENRYASCPGGVAVLADDTWSAIRGREALVMERDEGPHAADGSERVGATFRARASEPAEVIVRDQGDVTTAMKRAVRIVEADYELPILAQACMEPISFTAHARPDGCETWGPTQRPVEARDAIAAALGIAPESVTMHPTLEGGGYGRRLAVDYAMEAALISRAAGAPVKVIWTREDDFRGGYYRTPSYHRLAAGIDDKGRLTAWRHHLQTAPLLAHIAPGVTQQAEVYDVGGAADIPWEIENVRIEYTPIEIGLQMGSWRSVSHSFNVFVVNCFLDECAHALGRDPWEFHSALLGDPREVTIELPYRGRRGRPTWDTGRLRRVLDTAARASGWNDALPAGRGRGIACGFFKKTFTAHVAEVTALEGGRIRVDRIVAAIDCGHVVNPDGVAAQVEGGAMDGTASVLKWGITFDRGRPLQENFDAHPMLRVDEAPRVEVHIVPSDQPPSGTGEPSYPTVAPAIVNAIFKATGRRVRRLPITPGDLT